LGAFFPLGEKSVNEQQIWSVVSGVAEEKKHTMLQQVDFSGAVLVWPG